MASNAFTTHLLHLLRDGQLMNVAHSQLPVGLPARQACRLALNRAAVVLCVSAWEAYIEELVRESLEALRPPAPPLGLWPALNASVRAQLGRFNNPGMDNVRQLISDVVGLPNVQHSWKWQNCTSAQAVERLATVMDLRHQIAHGVNPRPVVQNFYAIQLREFFRRLGRCTDRAVRNHFVTVHHLANPWPA